MKAVYASTVNHDDPLAALAVGEQVTVPGRTRVTVIRSFQAVETVGES